MMIQNEIDSKEKHGGKIEYYIEEQHPDFVKSRMPVTKDNLNPYGVVQAGALLWLADVTAAVLAVGNIEISNDGKGFPLSINLNSSFLSNQRNGEITAESRFVRKGRKVIVVRTKVTGKDDKLLAEVTTTHVPAE